MAETWTCECNYQNSGPVCTHCGRLQSDVIIMAGLRMRIASDEELIEKLVAALRGMNCICLPRALPFDGECDRCAALRMYREAQEGTGNA